MTKVIDLTPTWKETLNLLLLLLSNGDATGQKAARVELAKMADLADRYVESQKKS